MPSTVIASFDYQDAQHVLDIRFHSGRVYRYENVPLAIVEALRRARSKGSYYNRQIRNKFRFMRLQ
ncbi:MAG: KTSC domain-containing protein [Chitinophagaceae bacterium]|uniref:KTSC domain-containing protein n=1 Tax=Rurimicrobium arvi TaxID=2049916 RepID=A0ABP8MFG5_9BACT